MPDFWSVSFLLNRENAVDFSMNFPLAAKAVCDSFYVDDGLTGADSVDQAVELYRQLQSLFTKGGFLLRKWNSSKLEVLRHIDTELQEQRSIHTISDPDEYSKTLWIEWNTALDHFHIAVVDLLAHKTLTK